MAGFNLDPHLLAQMAQGAFRPPQAQSMPGFNMASPQSAGGGVGFGEGMAGLGAGLGALKGMMGGGGLNPNGMPEDANLGGAVSAINNLQPGADGKFAPVTMPTDIGFGQGGLDPLTGLVNWVGRQFRPGGA